MCKVVWSVVTKPLALRARSRSLRSLTSAENMLWFIHRTFPAGTYWFINVLGVQVDKEYLENMEYMECSRSTEI